MSSGGRPVKKSFLCNLFIESKTPHICYCLYNMKNEEKKKPSNYIHKLCHSEFRSVIKIKAEGRNENEEKGLRVLKTDNV